MHWIALAALAQQPNPAEQQKKQEEGKEKRGYYVVTAPGPMQEENRGGDYAQPFWTYQRLFTGVRTYVIPDGEFEFEFWLARMDVPRKSSDPMDLLYLWEFEMGLPYRFQIDLYLGFEELIQNTGDSQNFSPFALNRQQVEVRWALADWWDPGLPIGFGKGQGIPGNPTLYLEYVHNATPPDEVEMKLLFAGEIVSRVHWGLNLVLERGISLDLHNEWHVTAGVSYTLIDSVLSVGLEADFQWVDTVHTRGHFTDTYFLGPTMRLYPLPRMHIDLSVLPAIYDDSSSTSAVNPAPERALRIILILGWEF